MAISGSSWYRANSLHRRTRRLIFGPRLGALWACDRRAHAAHKPVVVVSTEKIAFRRKKREARKTAQITGAAPRRWSVVASRYYRRFRCGGLGRRRLLSCRHPRP